MHMNMYLFFEKLNILCIFNDRFFDPVFFRFQFLGSTGSMTGPVLVTLGDSDRTTSCYANYVPTCLGLLGQVQIAK
jgi:hypothetical protein